MRLPNKHLSFGVLYNYKNLICLIMPIYGTYHEHQPVDKLYQCQFG